MLELTRTELKFLITYDEYLKLKHQLALLMTLDLHADPNTHHYSISSVYFDDLYASRVSEKADGIEYHQKFRLRSYSRDDVRLEYKTKVGVMTNKESLWVSENLMNALLTGEEDTLFEHVSEPLIEDFVVRHRLDRLEPVLVIDYDREAYICDVGTVRITFDRNITAYRYGSDKAFARRVHEPGQMVLEVKYTGLLPDSIRKIVFSQKLQVCSFSKYYMGWMLWFN